MYSSESWPLVMEDGLILDRILNDVPSKECEGRDWPIPGINEGVRGWERTADPAMTVAGGVLIIADKRELVVVDCDPRECSRLAAFRRDLKRWSMPVVAGGRLYLRVGGRPGELLCYDVS